MYRFHEALDDRREYERNHEFYLCEICSIRFEFGEAMDWLRVSGVWLAA